MSRRGTERRERHRQPVALEQGRLLGAGSLGLAAAVTQPAQQTLGNHPAQGGGDQEIIQPQVAQPHDGPDRAVGVQRGKYQMTGQRRLNRDVADLHIADLADDHVFCIGNGARIG